MIKLFYKNFPGTNMLRACFVQPFLQKQALIFLSNQALKAHFDQTLFQTYTTYDGKQKYKNNFNRQIGGWLVNRGVSAPGLIGFSLLMIAGGNA